MEALRLIKGGQSVSDTAKILGVPKGSLENWMRWEKTGVLAGTKDQVVSPEQMERARLRAELSRVKMERYILEKATVYFAKEYQ